MSKAAAGCQIGRKCQSQSQFAEVNMMNRFLASIVETAEIVLFFACGAVLAIGTLLLR